MSPATMLRNALYVGFVVTSQRISSYYFNHFLLVLLFLFFKFSGRSEGGSGVPLDREAYMRSVQYWEKRAIVQ